MEGKKGRIKMLGTYGVEKVVLKFRYTTQREVSMRLANFDFFKIEMDPFMSLIFYLY